MSKVCHFLCSTTNCSRTRSTGTKRRYLTREQEVCLGLSNRHTCKHHCHTDSLPFLYACREYLEVDKVLKERKHHQASRPRLSRSSIADHPFRAVVPSHICCVPNERGCCMERCNIFLAWHLLAGHTIQLLQLEPSHPLVVCAATTLCLTCSLG